MVHGSEGLPGEAALLPEGVPKVAAVPAVQEIYVGLADGDVGRSGVSVQLLVPLLKEFVFYALCGATRVRQRLKP